MLKKMQGWRKVAEVFFKVLTCQDLFASIMEHMYVPN